MTFTCTSDETRRFRTPYPRVSTRLPHRPTRPPIRPSLCQIYLRKVYKSRGQYGRSRVRVQTLSYLLPILNSSGSCTKSVPESSPSRHGDLIRDPTCTTPTPSSCSRPFHVLTRSRRPKRPVNLPDPRVSQVRLSVCVCVSVQTHTRTEVQSASCFRKGPFFGLDLVSTRDWIPIPSRPRWSWWFDRQFYKFMKSWSPSIDVRVRGPRRG